MEAKTVFLLCTGSSCCAQMAETMLNHVLRGQIRALSVAPQTQPRLDVGAIKALQLGGFAADLPCPRVLEEVLTEQVDLIIVLGTSCGGSLPPVFRSVPRMRVHMDDPQGGPLASFIRARNEILERLIPIVRTALEI